MPDCDHSICQKETKGVGVCIVDPTHQQILLGLERFGKYRGKFNICAGSLEPEDGGCAVNAAKRELREEFKLHLNDAQFGRHFGLLRGLRYIMIGPTPVFIGHFDHETVKCDDLTTRMQAAIHDDMLPGTQKEMEEGRWFPWKDHDSMEWSRFARVSMKKAMPRSCSSKSHDYVKFGSFGRSSTNAQS